MIGGMKIVERMVVKMMIVEMMLNRLMKHLVEVDPQGQRESGLGIGM